MNAKKTGTYDNPMSASFDNFNFSDRFRLRTLNGTWIARKAADKP